MRLRHKKNAESDVLNSPLVINVGANTDLVRASFTNPSQPLHLELGMGKGKFIIELAKQNPGINYIGIERSATIVLKAIDNYVGADTIRPLVDTNTNLRLMCLNVETLENVFPAHSIDKIYLNFSDPWPKKRHESRRLTHHKFLSIYETLLKPGSLLEFKTDNVGLFDFSLEEIKNSNFKLLEYTYDLHNDEKLNKNNIMTEYEAKFSKLGNKICKLIAQI